MSDRSAATGHPPLADTARDRLMGNPAAWLGARLAIADAAERAARCPGGARG